MEAVLSCVRSRQTSWCRGTATAAGVLFRSWNAGGEGSAAIVFDWERNVLEAVFEGAGLDLGSTPDLDPEDDSLWRVGGPAEHVQAGRPFRAPVWLATLHPLVLLQADGRSCNGYFGYNFCTLQGFSRHEAHRAFHPFTLSVACRMTTCTCGCCWTTRP